MRPMYDMLYCYPSRVSLINPITIFSNERNFEVICYQLYQLPLSAKAIPLD
jgi:hypothetical protein